MERIVGKLGIIKVLEDDFDYSELNINYSFARDLGCQYFGEVFTLWKNEFKNTAITNEDQKRIHLILGLKMINFLHNISRRCLLIVENRLD